MASIYKQGRVYWIQYYHGGKRYQESLNTRDRKEAKYLCSKKEADLVEKPFQSVINERDIWDILRRYNEESRHLKTKDTIYNNNSNLTKYFTAINAINLADIKESTLRSYLLSRLESKSLDIITANTIIRHVKTFLNWCVNQNIVSFNSLTKFKAYKEPKVIKRFLNREEIDRFLTGSQSERLYCAIATAVYSGMRLGELQRLKWKDVDRIKNTITIHKSKTGRFRIIPLSNKLKDILPIIENDSLCFDFKNSTRILTRINIRCGFVNKELGLNDYIAWKIFRHTFASQLVQAGVSLYKVSQWLGHSRITTTEIYAHLQPGADNDINIL